jgi:hypothetical protein
MSFNNYYLWFLIDYCHFVVDEVKDLWTFTKNRAFNPFVEDFMRKRIESNDGAKNMFYKINLNGAYGYDGMNTEKYAKIKLLNEKDTNIAHMRPNWRATTKMGSDTFAVQMMPKSFRCDTCLIEAFFTLDNAKVMYLNFIYNFMYKCLDMSKIHFIEGDTDSMYWAVSGDLSEKTSQGFKHVILDHEFYNKHVYDYLPASFYSSNSSNPKFSNKLEEALFRKKLGGLELEKQSGCMTALAPKMYCSYDIVDEKNKDVATHVKGVKVYQNPLTSWNFNMVLNSRTTMEGANTNLQLHAGEMSKIKTPKNILTAAHTKMKVASDFSTCVPLFLNINTS